MSLYGSSRYSYAPCAFFTGEGRFYKGNLHCHSTDSDGHLAWRDLVKMYRQAGYSFMGFSEHEVFYAHREGSGYDDFLLMPCVEWSSSVIEDGDLLKAHHVLGVERADPLQAAAQQEKLADGQQLVCPPFNGAQTAAEMAGFLRGKGCLAIYNHPRWSRVTPEDIGTLPGYSALEVYNHNCELENHSGYGDCWWDALLSSGVKINAVAGDDNHNNPNMPDSFGGWVEVFAPELTQYAVARALIDGNYYSSSGPRIFEYGIEDGAVYVKCSPAVCIRFIAGGVVGAGCVVKAADDSLTEACMSLDGREQYLRIECVDAQGGIAWSNPIYAREY